MFLFNSYISNFTKIRHKTKDHCSRVSHSKVPGKESKNTLQTVENSEKKCSTKTKKLGPNVMKLYPKEQFSKTW
jgi:hypothetical protein